MTDRTDVPAWGGREECCRETRFGGSEPRKRKCPQTRANECCWGTSDIVNHLTGLRADVMATLPLWRWPAAFGPRVRALDTHTATRAAPELLLPGDIRHWGTDTMMGAWTAALVDLLSAEISHRPGLWNAARAGAP